MSRRATNLGYYKFQNNLFTVRFCYSPRENLLLRQIMCSRERIERKVDVYKRYIVCLAYGCLCYRTKLHFHFFTRLWSVSTALLFRYKSRLVATKFSYFFVSASFLLGVWICIYVHAQLRILKFRDSVCTKIRAVPSDHKRVKKT